MRIFLSMNEIIKMKISMQKYKKLTFFKETRRLNLFSSPNGRCDGAGLSSSAGASYNLDYSRARAYCTCSKCGWGLCGHFYSHLSFLSSVSLSWKRPDID